MGWFWIAVSGRANARIRVTLLARAGFLGLGFMRGPGGWWGGLGGGLRCAYPPYVRRFVCGGFGRWIASQGLAMTGGGFGCGAVSKAWMARSGLAMTGKGRRGCPPSRA